jgi:hypothetical protein
MLNNIDSNCTCIICGKEKPLNIGDKEDWLSGKKGNLFFNLIWDDKQKNYWGSINQDNGKPTFYCPIHNPIKIVCKMKRIKTSDE